MTGRACLLADLTPLRESPAFRRLWAGSTLSSVGGALTTFAVALQVYRITRSPFAVGDPVDRSEEHTSELQSH